MGRRILGCIADDLTGATDLGNNLVRAGMRVILMIDVPADDEPVDADAIVVALKARSIPAKDAVAQSLHGCRWLRRQGVDQIYFKICSTFDSTPRGNIGPVIEALMEELECRFSVVVPSFPENGRTVYQGHMFVGDVLLSESGMRNHPLNPMTDSNLVRFLQLQLKGANRAGLIEYGSVRDSAEAIRARMEDLSAQGVSIALADTISDGDLDRLAAVLAKQPLVTAGSGLAMSLPRARGFRVSEISSRLPAASGCKAIVSGSCSTATNGQVRHFTENGGAARAIDPAQLAENAHEHTAQTLAWADACWEKEPDRPLLVYSTAEPAAVIALHARLGVERCGEMVERALARIASAFVAKGARQLVIAGGETSGVCARAIGANRMQIGPQIDPGVPWCYASSTAIPDGALHIALKSGNFGSPDFFTRAFTILSE
jgi:uncharacterized protein YgbK (DUF1537 family)